MKSVKNATNKRVISGLSDPAITESDTSNIDTVATVDQEFFLKTKNNETNILKKSHSITSAGIFDKSIIQAMETSGEKSSSIGSSSEEPYDLQKLSSNQEKAIDVYYESVSHNPSQNASDPIRYGSDVVQKQVTMDGSLHSTQSSTPKDSIKRGISEGGEAVSTFVITQTVSRYDTLSESSSVMTKYLDSDIIIDRHELLQKTPESSIGHEPIRGELASPFARSVQQSMKTISSSTNENGRTDNTSNSNERGLKLQLQEKSLPQHSIPLLQRQPKERFKCPCDIKILCRLIASHQKVPQQNSVVKFFVENKTHQFKVLSNVNIGQNVRCLVFERALGQSCHYLSQSFEMSEIIFAFNWFNPTGIWDYLSLGLKLLSSSSGIGTDYNMCGDVPMSQANSFFHHQEIRDILQELKLGYIPQQASKAQQSLLAKIKNDNNQDYQNKRMTTSGKEDEEEVHDMRPGSQLTSRIGVHASLIHANKITVTGFSMGGTIAHSFAVLLKEAKKIPQEIRCVGFGCPRPGNEKLSDWVKNNLTSDSMNIILASEQIIDSTDPGHLIGDGNDRLDIKQSHFIRKPPTSKTLICSDCHNEIYCSTHQNNNLVQDPVYPKQQKYDFSDTSFSMNQFNSPYCLSTSLSSSPQFVSEPVSILIYDPVTTTPSCTKGFCIHPNPYLLLQGKGGYLYSMSDHEEQRLKSIDFQGSNETSTLTTLFNMATSGSPFAPEISRGFDKLHSVLKYYEALCDIS